jgi:hypothetical protein
MKKANLCRGCPRCLEPARMQRIVTAAIPRRIGDADQVVPTGPFPCSMPSAAASVGSGRLSLEPTSSARPETPRSNDPFVPAGIFGLTHGPSRRSTHRGRDDIKVDRVVSGDGGIGRPI